MTGFQVRTDLALEIREGIGKAQEQLRGIETEEYYLPKQDLKVTRVVIATKNAEKIMGRPMGIYITMETPTLMEADQGYHRELSECFSRELKKLLPVFQRENSVLVVGLGNREVTADSLGPLVVDHLYITRHVVKEYGEMAYNKERVNLISALEPGVMAKTGMETVEIVKGVVEQTKPDFLIVVDALAARSIRRLNRTIQISNTGIQPGSGVGNHRNALTEESIGVPVIAVGVPTVVDAMTIVNDTIGKTGMYSSVGSCLPELNNMYMTGKDIDAIVRLISYTVSEGINLALQSVGQKEE